MRPHHLITHTPTVSAKKHGFAVTKTAGVGTTARASWTTRSMPELVTAAYHVIGRIAPAQTSPAVRRGGLDD